MVNWPKEDLVINCQLAKEQLIRLKYFESFRNATKALKRMIIFHYLLQLGCHTSNVAESSRVVVCIYFFVRHIVSIYLNLMDQVNVSNTKFIANLGVFTHSIYA